MIFYSFVFDRYQGYPALRAGILLCEQKCKNGILDYKFDETLASSTDGPMVSLQGTLISSVKRLYLTFVLQTVQLMAKWGESRNRFEVQYGVQVYHISPGQGLEVDEAACIGATKWSIVINARIINLRGLRKLIGSSLWDNGGIFVKDGKYTVMPSSVGLSCPEDLISDRFYKFGVTRSDKGVLSLFLNGFLCASSKVDSSESAGFKLSEHDIDFFQGDGDVLAEVYLRRIVIWDKDLEDSEMAQTSQCKLPTLSNNACAGYVTVNVPYSGHSFSSSYGGYQVGVVWGKI
jgi:hypothetical protein